MRIHPAACRAISGICLITAAATAVTTAGGEACEGRLQPLLGEPRFEMQELFEGERFPNVLVAQDGSVLATWGSRHVRVRRSEDGGKTWGAEIAVGKGIHGGGAIVDRRRGDVLLFVHPEHPPRDGTTAPRTVYRSQDHGKTWHPDDAAFHKDANGFVPSLHMMEQGTTLLRGPHSGRLIRPARVYRNSPDRYATTIYSDDGGRNWQAGEPFAVAGTGEAAIVELYGGRLLGTARKSFFADGEPLRHERLFAFSEDGGRTWRDPFFSGVIPDGPRYRGTERRGANYNGHFGMFAGLVRLPVEGRDALIYSNADHDGHERIRMTVWASFDGGRTWPVKRLVHEGPSAYSSLAAGRPGTPGEGWIYLQFEQGREKQQYAGCQLARFNLSWLLEGERTGDGPLPEWLQSANRAGDAASQAAQPSRPNIVLIITDDQGYGDLGHTGNPIIRTPHIDALAAESSNLTNYHVAPTCSPTRAALLTGHWTDRTGVWHTVNGRSMLRENEVTLAQMLKDAGYATGQFGKWHLGDNFPYRPEDRGFTEVYRHGGGGVGQTPDVWDNAYFDGHYFHNGRAVPARGFCTDVFFEQARRFIREQTAQRRPFFAYIAPNAPHGPLHAPQKYLDMYTDQPPPIAAFFGMISNIDDNVGATRQLLRELGIEENTLFVFTTDNGTATGERVFNAGMRGKKGSEYDGGHRVSFIAHWPAAGWNKKHVSDTLCHAVDIVPTLLEIAGAKRPVTVRFDGISILRLLDPASDASAWPHDRMLVTDSQRVRDPIKWKQTAVMSDRWRLVNGKELYDVKADPGQQNNVIGDHPERAAKMRAFYDAWWAELEPTFAQTTEIHLGHPEHPVVNLTGHDWIQEALPPWNQQHIREADGYALAPRKATQGKKAQPAPMNPPRSVHRGHWAVKVLTPGDYEISLRRWPVEADQPIRSALPPGADVPGASKAFRAHAGFAIPVVRATLRIDGRDLEARPVQAGDRQVAFTTKLTAGSHRLAPVFVDAGGNEVGAYYAVVTRK